MVGIVDVDEVETREIQGELVVLYGGGFNSMLVLMIVAINSNCAYNYYLDT